MRKKFVTLMLAGMMAALPVSALADETETAAAVEEAQESAVKSGVERAVEVSAYETLEEAKEDGTAFVLLLHAPSSAEETDSRMQMDEPGYENVFIGVSEEEQMEASCEAVIEAVKEGGFDKVLLLPLKTAEEKPDSCDMTGEEAALWKSRFEEAETFESVEVLLEGAALEDGVYLADFDTDSGMFHANEACDGKGTLTVENGVMTLHVSLASKNITNLFAGTAEAARENEAEWLQPTVDTVTYSDGMTEEVFGFDVPVPALDEEFDLALIGKKGKWYDHKVSVSNPEKAE